MMKYIQAGKSIVFLDLHGHDAWKMFQKESPKMVVNLMVMNPMGSQSVQKSPTKKHIQGF